MKHLPTIIFLTVFSTVCHVVAANTLPVQVVEETSIVISIPTDDEFYIGKRRVTRAEIAPEVAKLLLNLPLEKRVPYVKAGKDVKYATLISIRDDLHSLGCKQIGLVGDRGRVRKPNPNSTTKTGLSAKVASEVPVLKNISDEKPLVAHVATTKTGSITIRIGKTQLPLRRLAKKVRGLLNGRVYKGMIIEATEATHCGFIVQVIDELKAGGAESIGLGIIK